jgi:hypothetical protein
MNRSELRKIHAAHADDILAHNSVEPCLCESCVTFRKEEETIKRITLALYPRFTYEQIFEKIENTPVGGLEHLYGIGVAPQSEAKPREEFIPTMQQAIPPKFKDALAIPRQLSLWEKVKLVFTKTVVASSDLQNLVNEMNLEDQHRRFVREKINKIFAHQPPFTPVELRGNQVDPEVWARVSAHLRESFMAMQSQIVMDTECIERIRDRSMKAEVCLLNLFKYVRRVTPESEWVKHIEIKDAYELLQEIERYE